MPQPPAKKSRHKSTRKPSRVARTPVISANSRVARWGSSLGVRIPAQVAQQLNLKPGEQVSVEAHAGSLTIRPVRRKWTEAELLKGVTPSMVGGEIDWGDPVGSEVW